MKTKSCHDKLWTYLKQVLDRMAVEHVLQNLHALQLVIGLHKGEASTCYAIGHAPAQSLEAQCTANRCIQMYVL